MPPRKHSVVKRFTQMLNYMKALKAWTQRGPFSKKLGGSQLSHSRTQDFSKQTAHKKIRILPKPKKITLATTRILTFISLAFRSLDWVQVIHEGLIYEKRGRGKK